MKTVNEALSYLPSVIIRDQQGQEVARPQPRRFQGSVVLNTRIDGMNIIGPTAYAAEGFSAIQVSMVPAALSMDRRRRPACSTTSPRSQRTSNSSAGLRSSP